MLPQQDQQLDWQLTDPFVNPPLFDPPWLQNQSLGIDQPDPIFYGSGGDEDTPFDKHVQKDLALAEYNGLHHHLENMSPFASSSNTISSYASDNTEAETPSKEPLGMLYNGGS